MFTESKVKRFIIWYRRVCMVWCGVWRSLNEVHRCLRFYDFTFGSFRAFLRRKKAHLKSLERIEILRVITHSVKMPNYIMITCTLGAKAFFFSRQSRRWGSRVERGEKQQQLVRRSKNMKYFKGKDRPISGVFGDGAVREAYNED